MGLDDFLKKASPIVNLPPPRNISAIPSKCKDLREGNKTASGTVKSKFCLKLSSLSIGRLAKAEG